MATSGQAPPPTARRLVLVLHRYAGLALMLFLLLEGVTGSLLAFYIPLERVVTPELFAPPHPGMPRMTPGELAVRAEAMVPAGRVGYLYSDGDQASVRMQARDAAHPLDFTHLYLDPYTGTELGRRRDGDITQGRINILPFIFRLHRDLALGESGATILGVVALAWTLDCFYSVYLTLPRGGTRFWARFATAWRIKGTANPFRINYDVHRSLSLWFWPLFLIFGWSSVMLDLNGTYRAVMDRVSRRVPITDLPTLHPVHVEFTPRLSWIAAEMRAHEVMAQVARKEHLVLGEQLGIGYQPELGVYDTAVRSNADIRCDGWNTGLWLDGDSGALQTVSLPRRGLAGDQIDAWLWALHYGDLFGLLSYRILVCIFGIVVAAVCGTGFYIWLRKRAPRLLRQAPMEKRERATF
jgi:uncharacterized iron-regulated membrane protein